MCSNCLPFTRPSASSWLTKSANAPTFADVKGPERTGVTELDMVRMLILAEVAARTDDRTLLQQMVNDARDGYFTGSSAVRRGAAHVLALVAGGADPTHAPRGWARATAR